MRTVVGREEAGELVWSLRVFSGHVTGPGCQVVGGDLVVSLGMGRVFWSNDERKWLTQDVTTTWAAGCDPFNTHNSKQD